MVVAGVETAVAVVVLAVGIVGVAEVEDVDRSGTAGGMAAVDSIATCPAQICMSKCVGASIVCLAPQSRRGSFASTLSLRLGTVSFALGTSGIGTFGGALLGGGGGGARDGGFVEYWRDATFSGRACMDSLDADEVLVAEIESREPRDSDAEEEGGEGGAEENVGVMSELNAGEGVVAGGAAAGVVVVVEVEVTVVVTVVVAVEIKGRVSGAAAPESVGEPGNVGRRRGRGGCGEGGAESDGLRTTPRMEDP